MKISSIFNGKINLNKSGLVYNIISSTAAKAISMIVSFLFIPLLIQTLNQTNYGIWLTLTSFLGWFGIMDLGIGNGLRNKLTESLAKNDNTKAKKLVSTAYFYLGLIFGALFVLFALIAPFVPWDKVFNARTDMKSTLFITIFVLFGSMAIQFVLKLIFIVLIANHKVGYVEWINTIIQVCIFLIVYTFRDIFFENIISTAIAFSATPITLLLILNYYIFTKKNPQLSPKYRSVENKEFKGVVNLGLQFFLLQLAAIVIYSTDNFLIAHFFSPKEVTLYSIPFKYFSIITVAVGLIYNVVWGRITVLLANSDKEKLFQILGYLSLFWLFLLCFGILMILISKRVFIHWIGDKVDIPLKLIITSFFYVMFLAWCNLYGVFANASGKIKLQIIAACLLMILNIPICYVLIEYFGFGVEGIPVGGIICMLFGVIISPIQAIKIINNKANGIWR
jgi:O-antigen/teichoic acid export membrane protein